MPCRCVCVCLCVLVCWRRCHAACMECSLPLCLRTEFRRKKTNIRFFLKHLEISTAKYWGTTASAHTSVLHQNREQIMRCDKVMRWLQRTCSSCTNSFCCLNNFACQRFFNILPPNIRWQNSNFWFMESQSILRRLMHQVCTKKNDLIRIYSNSCKQLASISNRVKLRS